MFKRLLIILVLLGATLFGNMVFAKPPSVNCFGLPGCADNNIEKPLAPSNWDTPDSRVTSGITNLIANTIKYVAVIAVISLMLAGFMYLLSGGQEEKVNKAKKMIIWSLTGVLLSISAWMIINLINKWEISL
ncbi:hypothetical protein CSB08_00555 [Candidatus Gracilibacteria bacterium]|nr:MAG: hypothetical protein CSB08_00555 [Candidatus Gracilibacteria bacterium]PIE85331.1 MAG: hypothetical protein CSA08_02910 [Candidatus Gracilibacteria bacterium]